MTFSYLSSSDQRCAYIRNPQNVVRGRKSPTERHTEKNYLNVQVSAHYHESKATKPLAASSHTCGWQLPSESRDKHVSGKMTKRVILSDYLLLSGGIGWEALFHIWQSNKTTMCQNQRSWVLPERIFINTFIFIFYYFSWYNVTWYMESVQYGFWLSHRDNVLSFQYRNVTDRKSQ